jgi:hypothetical protein
LKNKFKTILNDKNYKSKFNIFPPRNYKFTLKKSDLSRAGKEIPRMKGFPVVSKVHPNF